MAPGGRSKSAKSKKLSPLDIAKEEAETVRRNSSEVEVRLHESEVKLDGYMRDYERYYEENKRLRDLIQKEPPKKIAELATKEHTIILNSNENVSEYVFPYTLKNVKHVELITGIMPKAQYRLNDYNNVINGRIRAVTNRIIHCNTVTV